LNLNVTGNVELADEDKNYYSEIVQLEEAFDELCQQNNLYPEHCPFAAISAALKLVHVGKNMNLLDENIGRALILYHIVSGSKTIPQPLT
jgi:hypothetical protein